jgi:hypothetical protein
VDVGVGWGFLHSSKNWTRDDGVDLMCFVGLWIDGGRHWGCWMNCWNSWGDGSGSGRGGVVVVVKRLG